MHFVSFSITVLRILLLRDSEPERWQIIDRMMDHEKEHKAKIENWEFYKEKVVDFIRIKCDLESKFTEDEVFHVLGVLDVNSVRIHAETQMQVKMLFSNYYPLMCIMKTFDICRTYLHIESSIFVLTRLDRDH